MVRKSKVNKEEGEFMDIITGVWGFVAWLTGVIVSLAVGFGLAYGTLTVPWLSNVAGGIIVTSAGWVVVVLTILGALLAIIDKVFK